MPDGTIPVYIGHTENEKNRERGHKSDILQRANLKGKLFADILEPLGLLNQNGIDRHLKLVTLHTFYCKEQAIAAERRLIHGYERDPRYHVINIQGRERQTKYTIAVADWAGTPEAMTVFVKLERKSTTQGMPAWNRTQDKVYRSVRLASIESGMTIKQLKAFCQTGRPDASGDSWAFLERDPESHRGSIHWRQRAYQTSEDIHPEPKIKMMFMTLDPSEKIAENRKQVQDILRSKNLGVKSLGDYIRGKYGLLEREVVLAEVLDSGKLDIRTSRHLKAYEDWKTRHEPKFQVWWALDDGSRPDSPGPIYLALHKGGPHLSLGEFCDKQGIPRSHIPAVLRGERSNIHGWVFMPIGEKPSKKTMIKTGKVIRLKDESSGISEETYESTREAARRNNIDKGQVQLICQGKPGHISAKDRVHGNWKSFAFIHPVSGAPWYYPTHKDYLGQPRFIATLPDGEIRKYKTISEINRDLRFKHKEINQHLMRPDDPNDPIRRDGYEIQEQS